MVAIFVDNVGTGDSIKVKEQADSHIYPKNCHSKAFSPVNIPILEKEIKHYPTLEKEAIINGFKYGFPIHYHGKRVMIMTKKLKSANDNPEEVQKKIKKELAEGHLGGPFDWPPFPTI